MAKMKLRIELNHDGIRSILQGSGAGAVVLSAAESVRNAAGDGFAVGNERIAGGNANPLYKGRIARVVYTATYEAKEREATEHVLYGAVMSCR